MYFHSKIWWIVGVLIICIYLLFQLEIGLYHDSLLFYINLINQHITLEFARNYRNIFILKFAYISIIVKNYDFFYQFSAKYSNSLIL